MYALQARQVEDVIPWRTPLPLPRADRRVRGILHDRGRITTILGASPDCEQAEQLRIAICRTNRGYMGLPAGRTRCVNAVDVYGELAHRAVDDSSEGVVTFLDSAQIVADAAETSFPQSGRRGEGTAANPR